MGHETGPSKIVLTSIDMELPTVPPEGQVVTYAITQEEADRILEEAVNESSRYLHLTTGILKTLRKHKRGEEL